MLYLRSCPKCHGDVYDDGDHYGRYLACMQCGHYLTAAEEVAVRMRQPVQTVEVKRAEVRVGEKVA